MAILLSAGVTSYAQEKHSRSKKSDQQNSDNNELIGEHNVKKPKPNEDGSNNYRTNAVSGNPNNRTVDEGGNREATNPTETDESSTSSAGNNNANGNETQSNSDNASTGSVSPGSAGLIEQNSSTAGSPAVLSGKQGRNIDGTNSVQRAKPNMVGSDVSGIHTGKSVDQDRETRRTTMINQTQPDQNSSAGQESDAQLSQKNTSSGKADKNEGETLQQNGNAKQVAGPSSGTTSTENKNLKQPINSNAEDTNGRDVTSDEVNLKDVKAMDNGSTDLGVKKSKQNKKRRDHRRE